MFSILFLFEFQQFIFWLHWLFVAVHGLSSCSERRPLVAMRGFFFGFCYIFLNKLHIYYYKIAFFWHSHFPYSLNFLEINISIVHLLSSFQFQLVYVLMFDNHKTCSGFCFILLSDNLCFSITVFGPFTFSFYCDWVCLSSCYLFYIYATFSCFFCSFIPSFLC